MKTMQKRIFTFVLAGAMLFLSSCNITPNADPGGSSGTSSAPRPSSPSSAPAVALEGASIVLKVSHPDNDTSILENTWNCYARTFKNSLETYSGGEMTCDIYPNDQLGDLTSCMEQCSQGALDVCLSPASGNLATWVPDLACFDIPYLVNDLDVNNLLLQGTILDDANVQLNKAANMKIMSAFQTGFRNVDAYTKPVRTVADMKNMKFRLQSIDAHIAMAEAWGSVPTTVAFSELYSAASTGVIDASENSNYTLFMKKLEEVTKYITDTRHVANVVTALISTKTYEKLTPEQQSIVDRAADDARRASIGVVAANEINVTQKLLNAGVELIALTDEQRAEFKDACYDYCLSKVLPKINIDFYNKYLAEYAKAEEMLSKT